MFPRFTHEASPLFRLLDEYDRTARTSPFSATAQGVRSFTPKFDVIEKKEAYELHGELPGLKQENIDIAWTDSNTLTVSGRVEHRAERGEGSQGFVEGEEHGYQKPSIEDEQGQKAESSTGHTDQPKYWVTERAIGEFHRSFSFPGRVDQDNVKASLKDGILTIIVPKAQAPKARRINIE
ncbi:Heat shock protein Hsp20 [Macrophomina phaseolina MS6]|uniref:Heat shock protein Hsp20 n=2 Tax=Macrophomina phaseolina TaxID=35725 RepID=K2S863_MACPH|nr:Heat shock protein Hsp20 [Macrophomina phaseolina MS6]